MWWKSLLLLFAFSTAAIWAGLTVARQKPVDGFWVFMVNGVDGQIYRQWVDPASNTQLTPRQVTFSAGVKNHVSGSGAWLVFSTFLDGDYNVVKIRANGRDEQALTHSDAWEILPDWSQQGDWIVFVSDLHQSAELYRIHPDGSGSERLTANEDVDTAPAWSPDGESLVFQSTQNGLPNLQIMHLPTGKIRPLTQTAAFNGQPAWSPDGAWIAFASDHEADNFQINRISPDGRKRRMLTDVTSLEGFYDPRWSPNGDWLAYWGGNHGFFTVYLMRPDGSQAHAITPTGTFLAPTCLTLQDHPWHPLWNLAGILGCALLVWRGKR